VGWAILAEKRPYAKPWRKERVFCSPLASPLEGMRHAFTSRAPPGLSMVTLASLSPAAWWGPVWLH
jgi:hypothetical protein